MNLNEIAQLEDVLNRVQEIEDEFGKVLLDKADKEHIYKVKDADEYLKASGTVDERKASALIKCRIEHQAYLRAKAVESFLREKLADAQSAVTARQSLLNARIKTNFGQSFNQANA